MEEAVALTCPRLQKVYWEEQKNHVAKAGLLVCPLLRGTIFPFETTLWYLGK